MLKVTTFSNNKVSKGTINDAKIPSKTSLIDVVNPSKENYNSISTLTGISESELKEYSHKSIRPRVEDFENNSTIIFSHPLNTKNIFETQPITIIVSKNSNYVVLIRRKECKPVEDLLNNPNIQKIFQQGTGYIVYRVLDEIIAEYFRVLDHIEEESDKIEKMVVKRPDKALVAKIFNLKKTLIFFHKSLAANREVVVSVEKAYVSHLSRKDIRRFRDLYNDIVQLIDVEETHRDILTGTLDVYISSMSNNLNKTIKTLTIIASLILVPTLISGIYGMNFNTQSPLNMPELNWVFGYPFALGLMLFSVVAFLGYFKWKKWL